MRLLGLHGKGTNAFILRTQLAALARQSDLAESIDYIDGPVGCAPYHNIEKWFPAQPYYAWYDAPSAEKLEDAHDQLLKLIQDGDTRGKMESVSSPGSANPSRSTASTPLSIWTRDSTHRTSTAATSAGSSFDKPDRHSTALEQGIQRIPRHIRSPSGCAIVAGLLLHHAKQEQRDRKDEQQPLKFAIFICGSRPFSPSGNHTRYTRAEVGDALIKIPTLHLIAKHDPAATEGRMLASFCRPEVTEVVEYDGGHAPPRRSPDVARITQSIKRLLERAGVQ